MRRLGTTDLDILRLGMGGGGRFDEKDMGGSGLGSLGTGRLLDALASLLDRKMIRQEPGGGFAVTGMASGILWDSEVPLWARMLRLLQVRSCTAEEAASYLMIPDPDAVQEAESLRKSGQIIMTPQRRDGRLLRVYEIQEEGISRIDRADREGFGGPRETISEIERLLGEPDIDRDAVLGLLRELRGSL